MGLTWQPWTTVSEGSSTPGAPVAAVPWGESFALFIADPGGSIYAIKAVPGYGWEVVPGRKTKPGSQITAIPSGNRFILFMADVNGEIFTTSGVPYQGWDAWTSVSEGSSTPGAPVAAVPWGESFALFIADPGGSIYAIKAVPGYGWEVVPGRKSKPGAPVTAVPWYKPPTSAGFAQPRFLLFITRQTPRSKPSKRHSTIIILEEFPKRQSRKILPKLPIPKNQPGRTARALLPSNRSHRASGSSITTQPFELVHISYSVNPPLVTPFFRLPP
jgi:hypothetical protein